MTNIKQFASREPWIDNVKMFAIICVVVSHCFHYFSVEPYEACPIRPFFNAFNMHLFALISGYNAYRSMSKIDSLKNLISYVDKLSLRIALPCVAYSLISHIVTNVFIKHSYTGSLLWIVVFALFCVAVWLITCYQTDYRKIMQEKRLGGAFYVISGYLFKILLLIYVCSPVAGWFFRYLLITLIGMGISTYLCQMIFKGSWNLANVFLFVIIMYCIPVLGTSELAIIFAMGYILKYFEGRNVALLNKSFLWSILFLVFGLIFFYLCYYANGNTLHNTFYESSVFILMKEGVWYIFVFRQMCAICLSMSLLIIIKQFSKSYNWFSYWGARTLPLFGIHVIFISLLNYYLPVINLSCFGLLGASLLLGSILTFVTCSFLVVVQKSRLGNIMIMGNLK